MDQQELDKTLKKARELGINFNIDEMGIISSAKLDKDKDGEWKLLITYNTST